MRKSPQALSSFCLTSRSSLEDLNSHTLELKVLSAAVAAAAVAFPVAVTSGLCEYSLTCLDLEHLTLPPCSPEDAAEAALVAPALQACRDVAYFFTEGGPWALGDKDTFCNPNHPCGSLVPFLTNTRTYFYLCDSFKPYYCVMKTFHGYCRDRPVAKLPGDNGLLASLKSKPAVSRPTPAPSRPADVETPEPIPNSETPAPSTKAPSPSSASTAKPNDNNADANSKTASAAAALGSMSVAVVAVGVTTAALQIGFE